MKRPDAEDIVDPPIRAVRGAIAVPDGPGLGWEPVEKLMRKFTIRETTLPGARGTA